jgi:hypothetical protein
MGFEQISRKEELIVDIRDAIVALVKLKEQGLVEEQNIIVQLNFIKGHIDELVAIVGETDSSVINLKNLLKINFPTS